MDSASSWQRRTDKARRYLRRGDIVGLMTEARQLWAWQRGRRGGLTGSLTRRTTEAAFWDDVDIDLTRETAWTSAANFGSWILRKKSDGRHSGIVDLIVDVIEISPGQPMRGLVLGCGDMQGEHAIFIDPRLPFVEVDAYDVSAKSIERARQLTDGKGLKVNYFVADVNQLELPRDRYGLVVVHHAFHHFKRVDHVARQINQALMWGGVFHTVDYVGPRQLQFTARQLFCAQQMLQLLPSWYRREPDGGLRQRIQSVPPDVLSPDEAICSDLVLPAITQHLHVLWQCNWAGLLCPLLQGIAVNFDHRRRADDLLLKFLFDLDYALCQAGEVEPNFTITLATKR